MSTLLHLDASPLGSASITRHLTAEFVAHWKEANPRGEVIARDLTTSGLTAIDGDWIVAMSTPTADRTADQRDRLALSDTLITELRMADEYVIGAPMHNFTIAANLKLWIDQVVRVGETFAYTEAGRVGTLTDKKATFMVASGGVYGPGTAAESFNFVEPYLRTIFGFIGVTETTFHVAGGAAQLRTGAIDRETFLRPHVEAVHATFQTA